jgi:hypothetical protein
VTIDSLGVGKTIHVNWFLTGADADIGDVTLPPFGAHCRNARVPRSEPIGVSGAGNAYGFGLITLTPIDDRPFPPPVVAGSTALQQSARESSCVSNGIWSRDHRQIQNPANNTNNTKANTGSATSLTFTESVSSFWFAIQEFPMALVWCTFLAVPKFAVQIGGGILEVKGHQHYWVNGVENATVPEHNSEYDVIMHTHGSPKYCFDNGLDDGEKITIRTLNELYSEHVSDFIVIGTEALGDDDTGPKLDRGGRTIVDDANAFGKEWKVRADVTDAGADHAENDTKLFLPLIMDPRGHRSAKCPTPPSDWASTGPPP